MIDWLLDTLLATSALVVLVLLVREPVRRYFGSRATYGLWLIPAARLFMPTLTQTVERTVPAQSGIQGPMRHLGGEPLSMAQLVVPEPSLIDRVGGWPNILLAMWLGVAAALFFSRLLAFHRDRRAILLSAVRTTRIGSIRLVRSPEIVSPVALGIVRPLIAVPADFDCIYDTRERRLVLEHELAHHRSGDLLANLFAFVLLCLQWFNPLAWAAHAAFRFDQEAACDARVLDKVKAVDRADYGRAIAKAASGRALLFASALDRPNSLQRRLKSMLRTPNPTRRLAGRLIVVSAIAVALPLTASRAIEYVDLVAPAAPPAAALPSAAAIQVAPASTARVATRVAPVLPAAAAAVIKPGDDLSIDGDWVTIDGKRKRWEELTPAEKARVRSAVASARAALERTHIDRERIMRDVGAAANKINMEEIQASIARAQINTAEVMRGIEAGAPYLRESGQDPERIKASVRQALESAHAVDVEAIKRAVSAIDQRKMAEALTGAEESVRKAKVDLDRIDARIRAEQQH